MTVGYAVLVPLKSTGRGKSRLELPAPARVRLARAMARDTVAAIRACPQVERLTVIVETEQDASLFATRETLRTVADGLNEAIRHGVADLTAAGWQGPVAVLTADLPFLRPAELTAVLEAAGAEPSMVPDADGSGTSVLTAGSPAGLHPAFGFGSRQRHETAGHRPLDLPVTSGIRRDIDRLADLDLPAGLGGLGRYSAAVLTALISEGSLQVTVLR